jgi:hypothetical protein
MARPIPDLEEVYARVLFEVRGTNQPAQLALEGPYGNVGEEFYLASLTYRHLSASWQVANLDPAQFLAFFEDVARHRGGWEGEKRVSTPDREFCIACEYLRSYTPEVWMSVRLATDFADPYWTVELRLELSPDSLEQLAARARSFFTKSAGPGAAADRPHA